MSEICSIVALLLLFGCFLPVCSGVNSAETGELVNQAEKDLSLAFEGTPIAEAAGAEVDALLVELKLAGDYLSTAQNKFRIGDYETAAKSASDCISLVKGLTDQAASLSVAAKKAESDRFLLSTAFSGFGLFLFLTIAFLIWRFLRGRYMQKLIELKPAVEESL